MKGTITISGNSIVEAITGKYAAAIGTGKDSSTSSSSAMSGKINILDNAIVITEVKTLDKVTYDKNTNKFSYSNYIMSNGIIGEGNELGHDSNRGEFVIGPNVTINKIKGSNIEELKDYINYYIDKETGEVKNITIQGSKSTDNTENKTTNDVTTNTETVEEQVETIVHKKVVNTSVKDKPIVENISDIESIETNNINVWSLPLFIVLFACLILLRRKIKLKSLNNNF